MQISMEQAHVAKAFTMTTGFSRRVLALILLLGAVSIVFIGSTHGAEDTQADEAKVRKAYADKVRETYKYPFVKGKLSIPGNAAAVGDDFLEPGAFIDAQYCGHCH